MSNLFDVKHTNLKDLKKFYKKAPRLFNKAAAYTLNDQAFSARLISIQQIERTMTIRDSRFVKGSIQVTPTRVTDLNNLRAIYGSVERPRFTGWAEQETGERDDRKRTQTKAARRGSFANKMSPKSRLKKNLDPYRYTDFRGKNSTNKQRATARMLRQIRSGEVKRKPFIMPKGLSGRMKNFRYGLYDYKAGRFNLLQSFEDKPRQPKRNRWMTAANNINAKKNPMDKLWARNLDKILPRKL